MDKWHRTPGGYTLSRGGRTVAEVYATGSRLATDKWRWRITDAAHPRGTVHASTPAGSLGAAKDAVTRALEAK